MIEIALCFLPMFLSPFGVSLPPTSVLALFWFGYARAVIISLGYFSLTSVLGQHGNESLLGKNMVLGTVAEFAWERFLCQALEIDC